MEFQYMLLSLIDYTKFIDIISLIMVGVIGGVYGIMKFVKSRIKVDNFIAIHTEIHELLTELRVTTKCMRASILQFHNWEYTMDGISMRKFSVTHESTHKGYTSQVSLLKGSLCSMIIPLLVHVVENKSLIYPLRSLPESYTKGFFEDENVSDYACLPLKNKGANVGFVLLQWNEKFEPQLEEHDILMKHFKAIKESIEIQLSHQKN
jgi:hypothetical protein